MGAAASLSELNAQKMCPHCFDVEQDPPTSPSSDCIHYRPTDIKAWLKHWELDCLLSLMEAFGIETPQQCLLLTKAHQAHIKQVLDDTKLLHQWNNGIKHIIHINDLSSVLSTTGQYSLRLWLECWRLGRIASRIEEYTDCSKRDDLLGIQLGLLKEPISGIRPLELRRWQRALRVLEDGTRNEHNIRISLPSLETWLHSFELGHYYAAFVKFGGDDLRDVMHIETTTLQKFGFSDLDIKRWWYGLKCLCGCLTKDINSQLSKDHNHNSIDKFTLRGWLDCFNLGRLLNSLILLGAHSPIDLLDLSPIEVTSLRLKRLEMIRWERGLRQLHLTPTAEPMKVVMPTLEEGIEEVLLPEPVHSQSVVSQSPKEDEADDDNMDHLKDVVGRTSRFKENMNSGQWDDDLVEFILKEIKDFIKVQLESNRNHCIRLFADLLDSLHDGERMELLLSQLIDDVDLIQSNTNKAMYLRIASSLRLLHDQDYNLQMAKNKNKHKSRSQSREKSKPRSTSPIVVSSLSVKSNNEVVPVKKKKIKIITKDEKEDDDDEEVDEHVLSEAWSPKHKEDEEENDDDRGLMCGIDERVLGKLQYRWMATSFTMQGESARKLWVSRFRPPNFGYDDEWLTLEGMLELIRIVLQFTQSEISDDEIESFFNVLDLDNTGSISFYKLVGLLEADNVPLRQRTSTKYKATKKKRKRKKKKDEMMEPSSSTFCGPPWKPAGRKAAHD